MWNLNWTMLPHDGCCIIQDGHVLKIPSDTSFIKISVLFLCIHPTYIKLSIVCWPEAYRSCEWGRWAHLSEDVVASSPRMYIQLLVWVCVSGSVLYAQQKKCTSPSIMEFSAETKVFFFHNKTQHILDVSLTSSKQLSDWISMPPRCSMPLGEHSLHSGWISKQSLNRAKDVKIPTSSVLQRGEPWMIVGRI